MQRYDELVKPPPPENTHTRKTQGLFITLTKIGSSASLYVNPFPNDKF